MNATTKILIELRIVAEAADKAVAAINTLHIASRSAGGNGCEGLLNEVQSVAKGAHVEFRALYRAASAPLSDDDAEVLHRQVWA